MKKKGLWRLMVAATIAGMMAISGWTLNAVANMPKEYVLKNEFTELRKENRLDHKEIMKEIRKLYKGK